MMRVSIHAFIAFTAFCLLGFSAKSQNQSREIINIPDLPGYVTLKCDLHMHTVFSDGYVWPTVRVHEAWREGLDAIAITEHIEYLPHKNDITADHNRSYELAKPIAEEKNIILIKAAEITRGMPPGHLNVLFINDANKLDQKDFMDVMKETARQNAFVFWNHPGWKAQQPDTMRWFDVHTQLLEKGWLHGIEVVNYHSYYPDVIDWCKEKNLTMLGNSDIHDPLLMEYDYRQGDRRPLTLVFAKERTEASLKEALFQKRTLLLFEDKVIGEETLAGQFFNACLEVQKPKQMIKDGEWYKIIVKNNSELKFSLKGSKDSKGIEVPGEYILNPSCVSEIWVKKDGEASAKIVFTVQNIQTGADQYLNFEI